MSTDRHGRGVRGPLAWPRVPAMRTRGELFDEIALSAFERVKRESGARHHRIELAVEDIPPSDPAPWEDSIALARAFPKHGHHAARIVLYRRPIETRATKESELAELVSDVLTEQVGLLLGREEHR